MSNKESKLIVEGTAFFRHICGGLGFKSLSPKGCSSILKFVMAATEIQPVNTQFFL